MYGQEPQARIRNICRYVHGQIKELMRQNDLEPIVCPGDHEYGDNPWPTGSERAYEFDYYRAAFADEFEIPDKYDGKIGQIPQRPLETQYENTSFATVVENVLFVSLDIFHFGGPEASISRNGTVALDLAEDQAQWLDALLTEAGRMPEIRFTVVQSHCPISSPYYIQGSSGNTIAGGRQSALWQILTKHGVDVYIAGEVHAVTVTEDPASGMVEFVHGLNTFGLWEVYEERLEVILTGCATKDNPIMGRMVIDKSGPEKSISYSGDMRPIGPGALLVHYTFDQKPIESVANRARPLTGQGAALVEQVRSVDGVLGPGAASFVADDSAVVYCENGFCYENNNMEDGFSRTISVWVKSSAADGAIVVTGSNINNGLNLFLDGGVLRFGAKGRNYVSVPEVRIDDGQWHLLTVTYRDNASARENIGFYVDGREVPVDYAKYRGGIETQRIKFALGASRSASTGNFNFYYKKEGQEVPRTIVKSDFLEGYIDDFGFWYGALDRVRVRLLYAVARDEALRYDAGAVRELFEIYDRKQISRSVNDRMWSYCERCPQGEPGQIVDRDGILYLLFDENGAGLRCDKI